MSLGEVAHIVERSLGMRELGTRMDIAEIFGPFLSELSNVLFPLEHGSYLNLN